MKNMDKELTVCTKMGVDKSAENITNAPKFICPNCLPNPQRFGIFMKKGFIGRP